jgi:hypothetical protein
MIDDHDPINSHIYNFYIRYRIQQLSSTHARYMYIVIKDRLVNHTYVQTAITDFVKLEL